MSTTNLLTIFTREQIHGVDRPWLKRSERPVRCVEPQTFRILKIAEQVIADTHRILPLAINQEILVRGTGLYDPGIIDRLREERKKNRDDSIKLYSRGSKDPDTIRRAAHRGYAEVVSKYGVGCCGEHTVLSAILAQQALHDAQIYVPVIMRSVDKTLHHYVIIGDPRITSQAVACDAWPVAATPYVYDASIKIEGKHEDIYSQSSSLPPMRIPIPTADESRLKTVTAERVKQIPPGGVNKIIATHTEKKRIFHRVSYAQDISEVVKDRYNNRTRVFSYISAERASILELGFVSKRAAEYIAANGSRPNGISVSA